MKTSVAKHHLNRVKCSFILLFCLTLCVNGAGRALAKRSDVSELAGVKFASSHIFDHSDSGSGKGGSDDDGGDDGGDDDNSGSGSSGPSDDNRGSGHDDNHDDNHDDSHDDSHDDNSSSGNNNSGSGDSEPQAPPTNTPVPLPTNTPVPPSTNTPIPSPTNTPIPPTNTPIPSPTNTLIPPPTNTPVPPTNTPIPSPTNTSVPSPTNTLVPSPTNTPVPSPTNTPQQVATVTIISQPTVDWQAVNAAPSPMAANGAATIIGTATPNQSLTATLSALLTATPTITPTATISEMMPIIMMIVTKIHILPTTSTPTAGASFAGSMSATPTAIKVEGSTASTTNSNASRNDSSSIATILTSPTPTTTSQSLLVAVESNKRDGVTYLATTEPTPLPSSVAQGSDTQNTRLFTRLVNRMFTQASLFVGLGTLIGIGLTLLLRAIRQKAYQRKLLRTLKGHEARPVSGSRLRALILQHLKQTKGSLALAAVGVLGVTMTDILSPWPLKLIFDYVLLQKSLPATLATIDQWFAGNAFWLLTTLVALYGLNALAANGFAFLESYLTSRIGFQLVTTLRRELFIHLQRLSLSFHAQSQRGELLNKVSSDTQALREAFAEAGITLVTSVLTIVGMCVVMLFVNWRLSLIPLISVPILLLVYHWMQRKLKETTRTQRKTEGQIAARLSENLAIMPLVQAFGRERDEVRRFDDTNSQNLDEGVNLARLNAGMSRTINMISTVGVLSVIFYGAWLTLNNQMTPGDVLLFVTYVKGLYKPIRDAVKLAGKLTKATVSAQRIDEILSLEPEITDKPDAIVAHRLQGAITFSNVTFGYGNEQTTIQDVSFQIAPGQRVALVGASGAGKSTITNLLLRLYEAQAGSITIDGVDLRDYARQSLRSQIGLVLQDPFLMSGTLAENIAYGKLKATPAEIETAARQAYIHDFIMTLPKGYNTVIGELGNSLSGGQRQRIAIARALVKQPSILILDEPTSALDAESKMQVQETINRLQQGKTILCIAHQLSTVENFDKIIVMDAGRIVEQGTHRELLAQGGFYARLYRLQHTTSANPGAEATHATIPTGGFAPAGRVLQPALG